MSTTPPAAAPAPAAPAPTATAPTTVPPGIASGVPSGAPPAAAPAPVADDPPAAPPAAAPAPVADDPPAAVVPERYEFQLPEGMTFSDADHADVAPVFRELGLTQANAQKLVDAYQTLTARRQQEQSDLFDAEISRLQGELKRDPELGGANHERLMTDLAATARNVFGEEMVKELTSLGLHVHPQFVRGLKKVHDRIGEDRFSAAPKPAAPGSEEATLRALYPKSPQMFKDAGS